MYCMKCGSEVYENQSYCAKCGVKLNVEEYQYSGKEYDTEYQLSNKKNVIKSTPTTTKYGMKWYCFLVYFYFPLCIVSALLRIISIPTSYRSFNEVVSGRIDGLGVMDRYESIVVVGIILNIMLIIYYLWCRNLMVKYRKLAIIIFLGGSFVVIPFIEIVSIMYVREFLLDIFVYSADAFVQSYRYLNDTTVYINWVTIASVVFYLVYSVIMYWVNWKYFKKRIALFIN